MTAKAMPQTGRAAAEAVQSYSGRRFIIGLIIAVLVFWASIWLGFNQWRNAYLKRAEMGRNIAHQVRPLVESRPAGVKPPEWEDAVDVFEAMLIAVTGSNLLGQPQLQALEAEIRQLLASCAADHEKSPALIREFWNSLFRRTGPTTEIYGRPELFRN
ncbi:MAG: hypothetical protein ACKO5E_14585 [bacterium]